MGAAVLYGVGGEEIESKYPAESVSIEAEDEEEELDGVICLCVGMFDYLKGLMEPMGGIWV